MQPETKKWEKPETWREQQQDECRLNTSTPKLVVDITLIGLIQNDDSPRTERKWTRCCAGAGRTT